jgi:hypothetical protein
MSPKGPWHKRTKSENNKITDEDFLKERVYFGIRDKELLLGKISG